MTTPDPAAVKAAAEALTLIPGTTVTYPQSVAMTVLTAALPILRAQWEAEHEPLGVATHYVADLRINVIDWQDGTVGIDVARVVDPTEETTP